MLVRTSLAHVLAAALLAASLPSFAGDDLTPRPQRVFNDRPRIEDYSDYNAFLVDIMEYRRQKAERAAQAAAARPVPPPEAIPEEDPVATRELYRIEGPESLDDALARARKLPHPVYTEPERFGRTTANSFPMPPMEGEDMSTADVPGNLQDMESTNPVVYEDTGASDQAGAVLADNPTNEDEARDKQANDGSNGAYQASYDVASRTITDSDGNHIWAPIYIENEIGYTVIRKLDIEVSTFKN